MVFLKREDWIFVFSVVDYLGRIKYTLFLGRMLQETGIVWKMRKKSIQGVVKEISFRKLLYPLLTLAATLLVFLFVPFYRLWNPVKITSFDQIAEFYNKERNYVDITWETLYYSGYHYLENGKPVGSYYYALEEDVCYFVILLPEQTENQAEVLKQVHMTAKLVSGGKVLQELIKGMAEDLGWTAQGLSAVTSHIVVNGVNDTLFQSSLLFGVTILLAAAAGFTVGRLLLFIWHPFYYPACRRLHRYGSVKSHIRQINKERREENQNYGDLTVTRHYLIYRTKYEIQIIPLKDIFWAYKYSVYHRFRKQKLTYTLRAVGRRGVMVIASEQKKRDMDRLLEFLEEQIAGIRIGYKKEYERTAKKYRKAEKAKRKRI